MTKRSNLTAYLALAAALGGIAWSAILVRWAGVPGSASAFYRVLIAGLVLIPWRLAQKGGPPLFRGTAGLTAVAGGVFFALDIAMWNTSVMHTGAAVASILGNNTPIFVGILSWIVFRKRPRGTFWIGLSLSLAGCLTIMLGRVHAGSAPITLYGNLLAVGGSLFFAAYLVTTQRVRQAMDTLTFNTLAITGSIVTMFVICVALRLPLTGYPPRAWMALLALGLVSQLAAYYALVYALGHLPATVTSVALLGQVPCTAFLAWLLLGEPLTATQLAGGAIVLIGIVVVNRGSDAASKSRIPRRTSAIPRAARRRARASRRIRRRPARGRRRRTRGAEGGRGRRSRCRPRLRAPARRPTSCAAAEPRARPRSHRTPRPAMLYAARRGRHGTRHLR